mgnify:CR=1 FL=1
MSNQKNIFLERTAEVINKTDIEISFTLLEVGARQISQDKTEPFYELLDYFPSSRVIGFEVEKDLCNQQNLEARPGIKYYPNALGQFNEIKDFYVTNNPMCSSLYEPDFELLSLYGNLEVAYLKSKSSLKTISLDHFLNENNINSVDFIKADVQGAELDILKGGRGALKEVLKIVCEVEFIPIYKNQPLFGDVCRFLSDDGFMFNKFLSISGRALRPIKLKNNANIASQHMWADAIFIKQIQTLPQLDNDKILKLSLLSAVYNSPDLVYHCLYNFDQKNSTSLALQWLEKF